MLRFRIGFQRICEILRLGRLESLPYKLVIEKLVDFPDDLPECTPEHHSTCRCYESTAVGEGLDPPGGRMLRFRIGFQQICDISLCGRLKSLPY